jgi:hypothetical protein
MQKLGTEKDNVEDCIRMDLGERLCITWIELASIS